MGLRARILAVTSGTGPRSKNVLKGLARTEKQREQFDAVFQTMVDKGDLVMLKSDKRWAQYGPPRQRGAIDLVLGIALVWVLLAIAAFFVGDYRGATRGRAEVQASWDKKNLEDARFAASRDADRDKGLLEIHQQRVAAELRASQAEAKAEEAKREARRNGTQLVACQQQPRSNPSAVAPGGERAGADAAAGAGAGDMGGGRVDLPPSAVFTWEFVREFDSGWSGLDGQPLSDLAAGGDGAERAGPAGATAQDIADVAGINARACSKDRREFTELIAKIERAAEIYDRRQP